MPAAEHPGRGGRGPEQRAAAEAARAERLETLHRRLADGVAGLRDGPAWRAWLDTAARFHGYSFGNQLLIAAQRPDATLVAGYRAWLAMGRQVRKGERAVWVLAPVTARPAPQDRDPAQQDDRDPSAGPADTDAVAAGDRGRVVGFRAAAVFDVSQTDGDPLPAPPRPQLLAGHAPEGLWDALAAAIAERGFTVHRCPDAAALGGANGATDHAARTVTVRGDVDDAQAVKTLAHEAGHVLLHDPRDPDGPGAAGPGPGCRGLVEVEAESVAYLVAAHHGLDTAGYTFAYIAGWAGRDERAVTATAGRVLAAARTLLQATDPAPAPSAEAAGLAARAAAGAAAGRASARHAEAARDRAAAAAAAAGAEERLRAVVADAQAWFLAQAGGSAVYAAAAAARGHTPAEALGHGAGYAPAGWTGLVDHLLAAGHTPEDLLAAGVAATGRGGRLIDRFRARITFPIHDRRGPVGFTARDTTGPPGTPKYLNTPATALFAKARLLYGTQHIDPARTTTLVLVEGPWDALAATAAGGGATVGVAACGTAVTGDHLDLAAATGAALVLAPDPDPAGTAALARTLALLAARGDPHPLAAADPGGGDLAAVYADGGADAVRRLLAGARPGGIVYAEALLAGQPPAPTVEARVATARAAAAASAGLTQAQREVLAALLTQRVGIAPATAEAVVSEAGGATLSRPAIAAAVPARHAAAAGGRGPRL